MTISRAWAMPSPQTFTIPPIAALLDRYLDPRMVVLDPFAREGKRGTITNDLNPAMSADYHLPAEEFCRLMHAEGVQAEAVLFDPPYSPRQISEVYQQIGRPCSTRDTQNARLYKAVRDGLDSCLIPGGIAISCGWNSGGFGISRGYAIMEILLVAHGGAHNDTIVTVERKLHGKD